VFIAAAAMVLAGCGNLSLTGLLSNESPGEFRLSPETVNLQVGAEFTFSSTGGFAPYNYQVVSGLGDVVKDQTWVYQAPLEITGDYIEVTIKATDQLGDSDTATVRVFNPFSIVPNSAVTIKSGGSVTIQATGGVSPYTWTFDDGTTNSDPDGTSPFVYTPATTEIVVTHVVGVTDKIGNYIEVAVTVLPVGASLTIDPVAAGVQVGFTLTFSAFGGTPPYTWTPETNFDFSTGTPVTYTATTVGTDIVTLTDSLDASVTATITVTADWEPLVLSPDVPTVMAIGDQVQFSATGGVPPYKFSSAPPGYIDGNGLYTQTDGRKKVNVLVKDSAGASDVTTVYYGQ
jgi:hypothetical protein